MSIDWQSFTPWSALAGGILIGAAASLLILFNGRIAGISGIIGGLLRPQSGDIRWRLAFIAQRKHGRTQIDLENSVRDVGHCARQ